MNRETMMNRYPEFTEGMTVRSTDGQKLGRITYCDENAFIIEKGLFFPKDYMVRYEDVADIRNGEVILSRHGDELRQMPEAGAAFYGETETAEGRRAETGTQTYATAAEETRVPVIGEELESEKTLKEVGQVRIHKTVVTNHQQLKVPVMKEEVHVQRIPMHQEVSPEQAATQPLQESTITIPVREEEATARKRQFVKEEVRVSKELHREEQNIEADLKNEEVSVEESAEKKRAA